VQKYHEAALVAYRKQDLDNAIALWNKALAIEPNYEPALGYRARAQELQRRLNQMGAH
jgi:tetratricopeptide (TPR) repeat protein